jgi:hypothetical protein
MVQLRWMICGLLVSTGLLCRAQQMPQTAGESLTGHRVDMAEAIRGHASIVVGSFSKDAGQACGAWATAVRTDSALAGIPLYQAAMMERAPGFVRGMVKASLRRQVPADAQDRFVVFTKDEELWRSYFGVDQDKDPYVVLLNAEGRVLWHGHGTALNLEPLLKEALPK